MSIARHKVHAIDIFLQMRSTISGEWPVYAIGMYHWQ